MTKPQALPFLVPFAAWFLARDGWLGAVKAAARRRRRDRRCCGCRSSPPAGPAGYARNLGEYQGDIFAILSLRAWNVWWLVQELLAGGPFVSDQGAILGPITLRHVGYVVAVLGELVVFLARPPVADPTDACARAGGGGPRRLLLLTTMHERYAYGALVFLALLIPDRRAALLVWLAFGVVFTLNLLAAVPPTPEIGAAAAGPGAARDRGLARDAGRDDRRATGSAVGAAADRVEASPEPDAARKTPQPAHERDAVPVEVVRQPLPELEVALAGGPVAPGRRDLGDPAARERRLDGQLEGELEAGACSRSSPSRGSVASRA